MPKIIIERISIAALQVLQIGLEIVRQEEARPRQDPVIWISHQQHMVDLAQHDGRIVREQKMSPAQAWCVRIEGLKMLTQHGNLDEGVVILLFDWHEHAHDVAHQMRAALRDRIQENRRFQRRLSELTITLIQIVWLDLDVRHSPRLPVISRRTPILRAGVNTTL